MGRMETATNGGLTEETPLLTESIPRTLCTPELLARLERLHARTGASKAYHVRTALAQYLTLHENMESP